MRCLVFSDVHGNLEALDAVLDDAGIADEYWFLGDFVGYGPNPNECIESIRALVPLRCVSGNHDWVALGKIDMQDYGPKVYQVSLWTQHQLVPRSRDYLARLPERVVEGDFTLIHGSPRDPIWEYVDSASIAEANLAYFATPYCFLGHTHVPAAFVQDEDGCQSRDVSPSQSLLLGSRRTFVNPGSVGQPRNGDTRAAYAILDTAAMVIEYRRVAYSYETTQRKMQRAGVLSYWPISNDRFDTPLKGDTGG